MRAISGLTCQADFLTFFIVRCRKGQLHVKLFDINMLSKVLLTEKLGKVGHPFSKEKLTSFFKTGMTK